MTRSRHRRAAVATAAPSGTTHRRATSGRRRAHLALALTVLAAGALGPAATADAGSTQESIIEDEAALLQQGAPTREATLDDMRDLGADTIRTVVYWRSIAPSPDSRSKPSFDERDPGAYPAVNWDALDGLVRGADARGLKLLFSPSSPIPRWASGCKRATAKEQRTCKPNATSFGRFVEALGRRYSGSYADENEGGGVLPRVDRWSIWNEPNQPGWLTPQYESKNRRKFVSAAVIYRNLANAAFKGLRAAGHGGGQLLLGETAPIGRESGLLARRPAPPAQFIRDLLCIGGKGKRLTGKDASIRKCGRFKKFNVKGFAHHPYTRGGSQPPSARPKSAELTIASGAKLKSLLTQAAKVGRIPAKLPVWYTEFGYQSNPPDSLFGVSLDEQAAYINEADWMAYRDSRIRAVAQYKLTDEQNLANFQTGLRFISGRAKPAYDAYRVPVFITRVGSALRVWGQIRPAADGSAERVEIQHQPVSGGNYTTVETIDVSSRKGYFFADITPAAGMFRLKWTPASNPGAAPLYSREAAVASR